MSNIILESLVMEDGEFISNYALDNALRFIKKIYSEAYYAGQMNSAYSSIYMPNDEELKSIVERICIAVNRANDFFNETSNNPNTINQLIGKLDSYENIHCLDPKVVLGTIRPKNPNKKLKLH